MTDPRLQTLVGLLRGQGYRAALVNRGIEHVVVYPEVGGGRVDVELTSDGWQLTAVGVAGLAYHSSWRDPRGSGYLLIGIQLDHVRELAQRLSPDQGRTPGSEALCAPERGGMEGPGGTGAQDAGPPRPPRWVRSVANLGTWGGIAGFLAFAGWSEPAGPIDSGWALAGGLGSLGVALGTFAWTVWYAGRLRRRRRGV